MFLRSFMIYISFYQTKKVVQIADEIQRICLIWDDRKARKAQ